jgi:hypothetical protein
VGVRVIAEGSVWETYAQMPDLTDRAEAWSIIGALVDEPRPSVAKPNTWEFGGERWAGYSIDLSSGRGFVPYAPIQLETGEEVIRLWPIVWYPGDS